MLKTMRSLPTKSALRYAALMSAVLVHLACLTSLNQDVSGPLCPAKVPLRQCQNRRHVLGCLDGSRNPVSVLREVLRQQSQQIPQPCAGLPLQGEVVLVHLVHFPAPSIESAAPGLAGCVDQVTPCRITWPSPSRGSARAR